MTACATVHGNIDATPLQCIVACVKRTYDMMALPFLTLFGALIAACLGRRSWSMALWALTLVLLMTLFRLHATDSLPLQF